MHYEVGEQISQSMGIQNDDNKRSAGVKVRVGFDMGP